MHDPDDNLARVDWKPKLAVIGDNSLQQQLMCSFFEQEGGTACKIFSNINELQSESGYQDAPDKVLCLIDYLWLNDVSLVNDPDFLKDQWPSGLLAMLNVPEDTDLSIVLLQAGIRGIFQPSDSPSIVLKGIRAILRGEIWYPRQVLCEYIQSKEKGNGTGATGNGAGLTARERAVLHEVRRGKTNEAIAEELFISPYTVKNHLSNIYRKIGVSNRLQALFWASKNLK